MKDVWGCVPPEEHSVGRVQSRDIVACVIRGDEDPLGEAGQGIGELCVVPEDSSAVLVKGVQLFIIGADIGDAIGQENGLLVAIGQRSRLAIGPLLRLVVCARWESAERCLRGVWYARQARCTAAREQCQQGEQQEDVPCTREHRCVLPSIKAVKPSSVNNLRENRHHAV